MVQISHRAFRKERSAFGRCTLIRSGNPAGLSATEQMEWVRSRLGGLGNIRRHEDDQRSAGGTGGKIREKLAAVASGYLSAPKSEALKDFSSTATSDSLLLPAVPDPGTMPLTDTAAIPATNVKAVETPDAARTTSPIMFEAFSREFDAVMSQDVFDGLSLESSHALSPSLQVSSSLQLGTTMKERGRQFSVGPTYAKPDGSMLAAMRIASDGGLTGRFVKSLSSWGLDLKSQANVNLGDISHSGLELSADRAGMETTTGLKAVWQSAWILNGSYSRVLTPNLQAGGEVLWVSSNGASIGSCGARYLRGKDFFYGGLTRQPDFRSPTAGQKHCLKLQHARKIDERISVGSELEYAFPDHESNLRAGYECSFRQARVSGAIDTNGRITASVNDYSGLGVSATADLWRGDYRFGLAVQISPSAPSS